MDLKILNETHPLVEEAWSIGLDLVLKDDRMLIHDTFENTEKNTPERSIEKSRIEKAIKTNEKAVRTYLASLSTLCVKIDSKKLNDQVWLIGTKALRSKVPEGEVGYLPSEVMWIKKAKWSDETFQKIHLIKKVMGGTIIELGAHIQQS